MNYPTGYQIPPDPARDERRIEGMLSQCRILSGKISGIRNELEEAEAFLQGAKYLDFQLKDAILQGYDEKISGALEELFGIRAHLNELGYDFNGKG